MKKPISKHSILRYLMPMAILLTFSCNQEAKKEEAKASTESNIAASEVKLDKQMPDATTSIFDWAKTQTPYETGGFQPAATTMDTRFGKLEFPGGYPTEETIQKVYDELDLTKSDSTVSKHVPCPFYERNDRRRCARLWHP